MARPTIREKTIKELIMQEWLDDSSNSNVMESFPSEGLVRITEEDFTEALKDIKIKDVDEVIDKTDWVIYKRFVNIYEATQAIIAARNGWKILNQFLYKPEEEEDGKE